MTGARTQVDILTGFLGSGKTTLLNQLLATGAFNDTAVVVNELGEIGLDHLLVEERTDQVALLEGGCLCCAVVDSLPETLLELCRKRVGGAVPPFRRIVIETTGLADPGPIVEVIRRSPLLAHFLAAGLVITALDMLDWNATLARHPEAMRQLLLADRVVLTKLDLRAGLPVEEREAVQALNPIADLLDAAQVAADPCRLLAPAPLDAQGDRIHDAGDSAHASHTHGVRAYSFPIGDGVTRAGLAAFARALEVRIGDALLRCKGVVLVNSRPILVQGVGTRFVFEEAGGRVATVVPHITCIVQQREREEIASLLPWLHVPEGTMPPLPEEI